jgi:DNA-binding response OmpR family regulator
MTASILVIDDDDRLLQLVAGRLGRQGYVVHSAQSGRIGLKVFEAEHPDLVITDMLMPDMDGIETLLTLKAKARAPKVIAMSGGGRLVGRDVLKWAIHLGADHVLPKPFRMSALLAMVGELLGEVHAPKAAPPAWSPEPQPMRDLGEDLDRLFHANL